MIDIAAQIQKADEPWWAHHVFHNKLEDLVGINYSIEPLWSKVFAWGYRTTAIYLEDKHKRQFVIKLNRDGRKYLDSLLKDITLSHYLSDILPTPHYIKNFNGEYIIDFENYTVRIHKHIPGLPPLTINWNILSEMVKHIKTLHKVSAPEFSLPIYIDREDKRDYVILHGDPTPENFLIYEGKVSGMLDFEWAMLGPREWDISKCITFSWFHFNDTPYVDVLNFVLEKYGETVHKDLVIMLSNQHILNTIDYIQMRISDLSYDDVALESFKNYEEFLNDRKTELDLL